MESIFEARDSRLLQKAQEFLAKAQDLFDAHHWPDEAGRASYLAGFHAAQALIFEATGKVSKSHKGVRTEFARLIKDDKRFDIDLRAFLGRSYNLKTIADYDTGPGSRVTTARAREAIEMARHFLDVVETLLTADERAPDAKPEP